MFVHMHVIYYFMFNMLQNWSITTYYILLFFTHTTYYVCFKNLLQKHKYV